MHVDELVAACFGQCHVVVWNCVCDTPLFALMVAEQCNMRVVDVTIVLQDLAKAGFIKRDQYTRYTRTTAAELQPRIATLPRDFALSINLLKRVKR